MNKEEGYYNDGGKHDNCTRCGKTIVFGKEKIVLLESGNVLYPEMMPFRKRKTKIQKWNCPSCGESGENYYLLKEQEI